VGLWIQLVGGSGSGKTFSALRMASGIAGDQPFAFIDTENRRGLHYADQFKFDHADLRAPFRPEAYLEAIKRLTMPAIR
jgi:RecA/RadA recombinase